MDIWEFYAKVDSLAEKWERDGMLEFSNKLKTAKASGSTSGEILGEIGLVLKEFNSLEGDRAYDLDVKRLREFVEKSLG